MFKNPIFKISFISIAFLFLVAHRDALYPVIPADNFPQGKLTIIVLGATEVPTLRVSWAGRRRCWVHGA